jgi:hypothetical protein
MESKGIFTKKSVTNGVYIYTENKQFISPKFWGIHEEQEKAVCTVIIKDGQALAVAPEDIKDEYVQLLDCNKNQTGKKYDSIEKALTDVDGLENTKALADSGCEVAKEVLALNMLGNSWHIPTLGELQMMYEHKSMLTAALAISEKKPLSDKWYWSSTRRGDKTNFVFYWDNGNRLNDIQNYYNRVRPVSAFSL